MRPTERRDGAAGSGGGAAAPGLSPAERSLLGFFGAAWIVALLHAAGLVPLAGGLPLSLYGYYAAAAVAGWLAGNVYVLRRRRVGATVPVAAGGRDRRLLAILYLLGPPALVYLLWAVVPAAQRGAAPLAPLWAFGVYGVFFLVPIAFPPPARRPGG